MGFCSAVTLAFATIFSLVAAALLAIAFSTDNWITISVQRKDLEVDTSERLLQESPLYFTRTRGLFRECFLGEDQEPKGDIVGDHIYTSPVETRCLNLDYYIPDTDDRTKDFRGEQMTRIHMMRAMIALFIVGFFFMFVAFTAGILGCWKTSPSNITASAILMLIACLFHAGGMGLWHGVEHWERNKIMEKTETELFIQTWPENLKQATEFKYDWSYIVAWIGVGLALIASILFSLAAVCIRTDKEKEDAMNMQYLMPVYHQKQHPYGPYGYAAYPGPYYGSQYGPYNY